MGFIGKTYQVENKWRRHEGYGYEMHMDMQKWNLVCCHEKCVCHQLVAIWCCELKFKKMFI
jgi:hypothetical protein